MVQIVPLSPTHPPTHPSSLSLSSLPFSPSVTSQRQPTETCTALDQMVENTPLIVQCTRNVDCNEAVCNVNSFGYRIEMELRPCHSPIGVYIKAFKDGGLVLSQLVDHSQRFTIEGVQVPVEMSQIEPSQPGALRSIAFKVVGRGEEHKYIVQYVHFANSSCLFSGAMSSCLILAPAGDAVEMPLMLIFPY